MQAPDAQYKLALALKHTDPAAAVREFEALVQRSPEHERAVFKLAALRV